MRPIWVSYCWEDAEAHLGRSSCGRQRAFEVEPNSRRSLYSRGEVVDAHGRLRIRGARSRRLLQTKFLLPPTTCSTKSSRPSPLAPCEQITVNRPPDAARGFRRCTQASPLSHFGYLISRLFRPRRCACSVCVGSYLVVRGPLTGGALVVVVVVVALSYPKTGLRSPETPETSDALPWGGFEGWAPSLKRGNPKVPA